MANEIERKFLVEKMPELAPSIEKKSIIQSYLNRGGGNGEAGFSVAHSEGKGLVKIKSKYEYEIPSKDAKELSVIAESLKSPTVRVRQLGEKGLITIKGEKVGLTQPEYEYEIPLKDAQELFQLCEPGRIEKIRYYIPHGNHVIELDVFGGDNDGLIMAEIELVTENDFVEIPSWFGKEVTTDKNYSNAALSKPKV
jgi:CYTH domain-containing protein